MLLFPKFLKFRRPDSEHQQATTIRALFRIVFLFAAVVSLIGIFALIWTGNFPIWGGLFFGIAAVSIYASGLLRGLQTAFDAEERRANEAKSKIPPPPSAYSGGETRPKQAAQQINHPVPFVDRRPSDERRSKVVQLSKYRESKGIGRPLRLLLVDDNRVNLKVMQTIFEKNGYSVIVADSGSSAIDMLDEYEDEIDAAIIDLRMPDLSGDEVVTRWRLVEKRHMPICILTADDRKESQKASLSAGADIFMAKPMSVPKMTEWLHSVAAAKGLAAPRLEVVGGGGTAASSIAEEIHHPRA